MLAFGKDCCWLFPAENMSVRAEVSPVLIYLLTVEVGFGTQGTCNRRRVEIVLLVE